MLKDFHGVFKCHDYQCEMFQMLMQRHPDTFSDILKEIQAVKDSHPSCIRDCDVSIAGQFAPGECRNNLKTLDEFNQFNRFEVQCYSTSGSTVQNSDWVTDSIVVVAKF